MKWFSLALVIVTIFVIMSFVRYELAKRNTPDGFYFTLDPVAGHECVATRWSGYYCEESWIFTTTPTESTL